MSRAGSGRVGYTSTPRDDPRDPLHHGGTKYTEASRSNPFVVVEKKLAEIAGRVRLVGRATPVNFGVEVARVSAVWEAGGEEAPRFDYRGRVDLSAERRALEGIAGIRGEDDGGLQGLYVARAAELSVEAAACEVAGAAGFWEACRRRFSRRDPCDEEADRLAEAWAGEGAERAEARAGEGAERAEARAGGRVGCGESAAPEEERVASDDERDPRSLVCAMRRAVGEARLPFRVVVAKVMAPLAATGDEVIFVAAGRRPSAVDTARTVLHEVMGHAAPAARAKRIGLGLLAIGTAFGSDEQEGRALLIEERGGFLTGARRRELGLRHLAARAVEGRASFVDTARVLVERGARRGEAARLAARAHRGGGLGREVVYLPALVRVRAALAEDPALDEVLGSGRVSVDAARVLRRMGWGERGG